MAWQPDSAGAGGNPLIAQRLEKAEELRNLGLDPYRNDFVPTSTAASVCAQFADFDPAAHPGMDPLSDARFALAGRIVEYRGFGKATFVKVADRTGRLQVYVRRDVVGEKSYAIFKKIESWDIVGVRGYAFFTKTHELTLLAEEVMLLTKAIRPPPEKWSGLKDQETRYRQRYVDLVANPEVATVFRQRAKVIQRLRSYLDEQDFLEVETPLLHGLRGGAAARPFRTHHNALDMPLYLRIAPELYLKRLLVGGLERVYEIGRNFRNEGLSRTHNPEFTMLEFYMAYATREDLVRLTERMLSGLVTELHGDPVVTYQGTAIDFSPPWPRMTVSEAVLRACAAFTPALSVESLETEAGLLDWLRASGLGAQSSSLGEKLRFADSHGRRLGALFDGLGEEVLPMDRPVVVTGYPAETSPLARRVSPDSPWVDRFELFVARREIANGFSELNDPLDQRQRFQEQLAEGRRGDEEAMDYDEDYCRALEVGMPPAAGEGIGIDRLVMLLTDQPSIRDVLLFPHMRPEG